MNTIKLKPIDEKGFCFDDDFTKRVIKKTRSKKKKEVIDNLLCATVVAEFLSTYEDKSVPEQPQFFGKSIH